MKTIIAHYFRSFLSYLSPRLNTEVLFWVKFKKRLNLKNPKTFNEKLLWLKLKTFNNNPLIKVCADKYRVRDYVLQKGCGNLLCNLIAVFDDPDEIEWDKLPTSFAMKLNVGCGCNLIVRDKTKLNIDNALSKVKKWYKRDFWSGYSELQYRNVERHLLVEEYIGNPLSSVPPIDYKFYCFNGICKCILICLDRGIDTGRAHHSVKYFFMDPSWKILPYTPEALQFPDIHIERPECLNEAIEKAEYLAKDFTFVRVDFFIESGRLYFGELTFTPAGAMDTELSMIPPKEDKSVDVLFGEMLSLPC